MTDQIRFSIDDHIATITLDRPDKLNALTLPMLTRLDGILGELEDNSAVRVVLLTANGRAFCVGADIHAWSALEPLKMWRTWIREGHRIFDRLSKLPQPTIAVLNGYTFGGGLELALAADLRLAAEGVQLALPEVSLGTIPGWGGTQRLPALIGPARAKELIFSGRRIDALTAERWGLVNDVVSAEHLHARAKELAETISRNAPVAVQLTKQLIDGGNPLTLESLASGMSAFTEDLQEGLAAFRQRRPADFKGK